MILLLLYPILDIFIHRLMFLFNRDLYIDIFIGRRSYEKYN